MTLTGPINLLPGVEHLTHLRRLAGRPWMLEKPSGPRYGHETANSRGRVIVTLGTRHRYANTGGWQYRYRLVVSYALERRLTGGHVTADAYAEHVDHINGIVDDDRLENLQLLGASIHGRSHALATIDARWRDFEGRFIEQEPDRELSINRFGPVVSMRPINDSCQPTIRTLAQQPVASP